MATQDTIDYDALTEQEMAQLTADRLQKINRKYSDFLLEFTGCIAQVEEDKVALIAANFDWTLLPKYEFYLEKMPQVQAERIVAQGEQADAVEEFTLRMAEAELVKKVLLVMAAYILYRKNDPEDKRIYNEVRRDSGDTDTLSDIVTLVNFGRTNMALVSQISPGGQKIDEEYFTKATKDVKDLMRLKGISEKTLDNIDSRVDRKNRLLTLMVLAEREMKFFAKAAFFNDLDYYYKHYASDTLRKKRKRSEKKEEESQIEATE